MIVSECSYGGEDMHPTLQRIQDLLRAKDLAYQYLAYAHCKKNPRELGQVAALAWSDVDGPLAKILEEQINELLDETKDENCFIGRYCGSAVDIRSVCPPELPPEQQSQPLVSVLQALIGNPAASDPVGAHEEAVRVIAWKYLAQNRSQGAVLCLISFDATLEPGRTQRFAFLTQVDLEDIRAEALIGDDGKLKGEELKNVFERKSLSKGALYPWFATPDQVHFDNLDVYVHNEKDIEYWKLTLECIRPKLPAAAERNRIVAALTVGSTNKSAVPRMINRVAQRSAAGGPVRLEDVAAIAAAVDNGFSRQRFEEAWSRGFGSGQYTPDAQAAVGPDTKSFEVVSGDVRIVKVRPSLLDQMLQVIHGGRRYLMIPLERPARFRTDGNEGELPEVTIEQFIERLRNPR